MLLFFCCVFFLKKHGRKILCLGCCWEKKKNAQWTWKSNERGRVWLREELLLESFIFMFLFPGKKQRYTHERVFNVLFFFHCFPHVTLWVGLVNFEKNSSSYLFQVCCPLPTFTISSFFFFSFFLLFKLGFFYWALGPCLVYWFSYVYITCPYSYPSCILYFLSFNFTFYCLFILLFLSWLSYLFEVFVNWSTKFLFDFVDYTWIN